MIARARLIMALQDQRGSVLLGSLMLVLIMTVIGATLFDVATVEQRLVLGDRHDAEAFHAAEGGLYRAFRDLADGDGTNDFATVSPGALYANVPFKAGDPQAGVYSVTATPLSPNQIQLDASSCAPAADPCPTTSSWSSSIAFIRAVVVKSTTPPPSYSLTSWQRCRNSSCS